MILAKMVSSDHSFGRRKATHTQEMTILLEKVSIPISYPYFVLVSDKFGYKNAANLVDY